MCLPYDKVGHAGGKTLNYYINSFANDDMYDVKLISKVLYDEKSHIKDFNGIELYPITMPQNKVEKLLAYGQSINSKINPFYKYGNVLTKYIYVQIEKIVKNLKESNYYPDVIIMEWTYMTLFIEKLKRYYPNSKFIASEHDVSFLGYRRIYENETNKFKRLIEYISYINMYNNELRCLNLCDLIVTHNEKDKKLLIDNNINSDRIHVIAPFYEKFNCEIKDEIKKNIIFYGAMNRKENYLSAIWFIDNVMPHLKKYNIKFIVIGNKPVEILKNKASENVIITGFVENPGNYFATALCIVAPLLLGAGVKVKVLEGLSSGIPVLTNNIGIEGIDAINMKQYIHCESAQDYIMAIENIIYGIIDTKQITKSALIMMDEKYNLEKSYLMYKERIERMF